MSEISTHSQWEVEIENGCEKKREVSPTPKFPPLTKFGIVRMCSGWMGFWPKVSTQ